jgi:RNA polymerase sigma-70 factor, ECF subfamily
MNATPITLAGSLSGVEARPSAEGAPALHPFRLLLDEVWGECDQRLLRLAAGLGLPADEAADAVQDVYLAAIERPPAIEGAAELTRWLFRVTANRCHLQHRRRTRWRRIWGALAGAWRPAKNAVSDSTTSEQREAVARALAKLSDDERTLIAMRYFSELNSREIGEILDVPEATIRGRLRTIRRRLASELAEWSDNE